MRMPPVPVILLIPAAQSVEIHFPPMAVSQPHPIGTLLVIIPLMIIISPLIVISLKLTPLILLVLIALVRITLIHVSLIHVPLIHVPLIRISSILRKTRYRHTQPRRKNQPSQRSIKKTFHHGSSLAAHSCNSSASQWNLTSEEKGDRPLFPPFLYAHDPPRRTGRPQSHLVHPAADHPAPRADALNYWFAEGNGSSGMREWGRLATCGRLAIGLYGHRIPAD
jgi:hypothetical protein